MRRSARRTDVQFVDNPRRRRGFERSTGRFDVSPKPFRPNRGYGLPLENHERDRDIERPLEGRYSGGSIS